MKIIAITAAAFFFFLGCVGCVAQNRQNEPSSLTGDNTVLVAYFSRTGNTERLAKTVRELAGGDLFEIVPVNPYPSDYNACLARASQELSQNSRPPLSTHVENMDAYNIIFIGYPIWCGNTPMVIRSFLEEYDLEGKTIVPFCTHGGSGLSDSVTAVRILCPGSTILDGLAVSVSNVGGARNTVANWIKELGLYKIRRSENK
ncbi:MAG: flavodoxin [Treponema sp.]|jgi:flavodoxin|nr:flavodoxin [Treponema sp.]